MNDRPALPAKLAPLIARLASGFDGEVVATVAAIKRTLDSAGLDFNDLANRLTAGKATHQAKADEPLPKQFRDIAPYRRATFLRKLAAREEASPWEKDFLPSIAERCFDTGWPLSDRQKAALDRVLMRWGIEP